MKNLLNSKKFSCNDDKLLSRVRRDNFSKCYEKYGTKYLCEMICFLESIAKRIGINGASNADEVVFVNKLRRWRAGANSTACCKKCGQMSGRNGLGLYEFKFMSRNGSLQLNDGYERIWVGVYTDNTKIVHEIFDMFELWNGGVMD